MDPKLLGFLMALGIQLLICVLFLSFFAYGRHIQNDLYFKLRDADFLPPGWFGWMTKIYQFDNDRLKPRPDAYVTVMLLRLLFKISAVFATLGLLVCLPINITGDNGESALQLLTAANVKDESYILCAHAVVIAISVAAGAFLTHETCEEFSDWRKKQLSRRIPENYFALIRGIEGGGETVVCNPGEAAAPPDVSQNPVALAEQLTLQLAKATGVEEPSPRSRAPKHLHHESQFQKTQITAVTLFCETEGEGGVQETHDFKHNAVLMQEQAEAEWSTIQQEDESAIDDSRPSHRHDGCLCCGGEVVDTITWCADTRIPELTEQLQKVQVHKLAPLRAGVVGFSSVQAATTCIGVNADSAKHGLMCETNMFQRVGATEVWRAPAPHDVCWENIGENMSACSTRKANTLVALFTIFFSVIVIFVASLANLESIHDKCGCLSFVEDMDDTSKAIVQDLVPVVVLIIFLSMVTGFLYTFHMKEVMHAAFRSHFCFLFVNLFICYLVSGSFFDEFEKLTDDPSKAYEALGRAIPSNSRFFTIYIMSLGLGGMSIRLLLIGPLIVGDTSMAVIVLAVAVIVLAGRIKRMFLAKSPSDHLEAMTVPPFDLLKEAPVFLVVLAIGSSYSAIAPVINPFMVIYFALSYLVVKQQLLCVANPGRDCAFWDPIEYDSAGVVMGSMIRYTMFCLLVAVLLNAAYFFVKQSPAAGAITLLVLPWLIWQWWKTGRLLDLTHQLQPDELQRSEGVNAAQPVLHYQRRCVAELDKDSCWSYCNQVRTLPSLFTTCDGTDGLCLVLFPSPLSHSLITNAILMLMFSAIPTLLGRLSWMLQDVLAAAPQQVSLSHKSEILPQMQAIANPVAASATQAPKSPKQKPPESAALQGPYNDRKEKKRVAKEARQGVASPREARNATKTLMATPDEDEIIPL